MTRALDEYRAAPTQRVALAQGELVYRVFGEGPAVLFLHGWPLSGITYRHLIDALKSQYRCIVPDLPGAGETPWWPSIRESVSGFAALTREFIDSLKLDRVALVGFDSGGGIARLVAAELGPRVSCLILQNTEVVDHVPFMVRALKATAKSKFASGKLNALLKNRNFRRSVLGFGECFNDRSLIEGEFFEACVKPLIADMSGSNAMLANLDLEWSKKLPEAHARIQAPIHLFWGQQDKFFPLAKAREMQLQFGRGGQLEVVNGKLYVHEEAPEQLARFSLPLLQQAFAESRAGDAHSQPSA